MDQNTSKPKQTGRWCQLCNSGMLEIQRNDEGEVIRATSQNGEKGMPIYKCLHCGVMDAIPAIQKKALEVLDDRWAFFFAPSLACGLFFRDNFQRPVVPIKTQVWCPDIQKHVSISFLAYGKVGMEALNNMTIDEIYPVNIWRDNRILNPRPSRTVSEELYQKWKAVVEYWLAVHQG